MWLILLSGFCGGRVIINHQERNTYILVLLFLTFELIIECTTRLFNIAILTNIRDLFGITLPLIPLIMVTLPISREDNSMQSVDILHALSTSTLISVLIFGSLLNMYLGGVDYLFSLVQTLLAIALFLFVISWLLSPKAGFSGLSQLWSSSLLNIGTPLEKWLANLSNLSLQQQTPEEFLEVAVEDLMALAWVAGAKWQSAGSSGELGNTSKHEIEFNTNNFTITIYSNNWMGGALYLHCNLLIQLIDNFYIGKIRERKLTHQAHLQAIHETGARVTHDIKNLLQSLHAITSIIQYEQDSTETKSISQRLLEKQMPHFTQRLQLALDKLQVPGKEATEEIYLKDWWHDFINRNELKNIEFEAEIAEDILIPVELFDSAVENMLENLREKTRLDSKLLIKVSIRCNTDDIHLLISDSGKKISNTLAKDLLKNPVKSNSGLGIGLYQVARLAESSGYEFSLKENIDGNVCFELSLVNHDNS